jgi:hypothetical protein
VWGISGILDGIVVPSHVGIMDGSDHLGLLNKVLGDSTPDIDHAGLYRLFHPLRNLVCIGDLIHPYLHTLAAGNDQSDTDGRVAESGDEYRHMTFHCFCDE